jgi:hypothetical protein
MLAAIALQGMIRPEYALAAFQQTLAGAGPPRLSLDTRFYSFCLIVE